LGRLLLFLIWPFGSIFANLSRVNSYSHRVFFLTLFIGFFGFSFIILGDAADIVRIKDLFYKVDEEIDFGLTFSQQISRLYVYDEYSDPFAPISAFLIAIFTNDHRFFMGVLGLIYGYYFAKVILYVDSVLEFRFLLNNKISTLLFLTILILIPIWQLNGIRFWTGTMFVIHFILRYIYLGKSLWPLLISPFFHSAFLVWAPLLFFLIPLFSKIKPSILQLMILGTLQVVFYSDFRVKAFDISGISTNASALEGKMNAYNKDADEISELYNDNTQASWFITLRYSIEKYIRIIIQLEFILVAWYMIKNNNIDTLQFKELNIILLCGILAYTFTLHPSPSVARFTIFFNYLVPLFFIRNMVFNGINLNKNIVLFRYRLVRFTFLFMLLFVAVVEIRNGFEYLNYALFLGNPFTIYFFGNETPLIEFYHAIFGKFAG
jgi:hypothetical protein